MNPWPAVRLGEVLIEQKQRIGTFDADNLPLLGVSNQAGLHQSGMPRIPDMSRYLRVEQDWFAYNPMRINVGSVGWAEKSDQTGVISPDYVVFSCSDRILPQLLFSFLKHRRGLQEINSVTAGSVRERLYFGKLAQIEFPLPPLAEQRRVVARIETLAAEINEARTLRQQAAEEAEALPTAQTSRIFEELLKGELHPIRTLGCDGDDSIQIGPFGAQLHKTEFVENGTPVLNVGNVWPDGLRLDYLDHVTEEKAHQLRRYSIKTGDLLFARSGATLGKVCLVPPKCDSWLMTGHLFRVRFDPERIFNQFAFAALRGSLQIQEQIFGQVRGATRPGYNTTLLGSVNLPVPPLAEQRRVVAELDALQAEVDPLKRLQAESGAELDALLPAILDKAFKGEL